MELKIWGEVNFRYLFMVFKKVWGRWFEEFLFCCVSSWVSKQKKYLFLSNSQEKPRKNLVTLDLRLCLMTFKISLVYHRQPRTIIETDECVCYIVFRPDSFNFRDVCSLLCICEIVFLCVWLLMMFCDSNIKSLLASTDIKFA